MSDDVSKNLEEWINNLPQAIAAALEESCQIVEDTAKRNCPVDDGILMASITHEVNEAEQEGIVGTTQEYSVYVHEGTGIYAKDGKGRKEVPWRYRTPDGKWHTTKGQKPQPFLQNAVDSNRRQILNTFRKHCGVDKVKTRFYGKGE